MSRQDKVPPIGPKPGFEAWGYDEKYKPQGTLEENMDPLEVKAQLEQRFSLRQGVTIKFTGQDILARRARFRVVSLDDERTVLGGRHSELIQEYPTWFILYKFNLGEWEVEE